MVDKSIVVYITDEEYAVRLIRALNRRKPPGVIIERVTEREAFWRSRESITEDGARFWLTDEEGSSVKDPGTGRALIRLSGKSDNKYNTLSFCQDIRHFAKELFEMMGCSGPEVMSADGPVQGIYGIYAPCGDAGQLCAAILSQELAIYGSCLYVNTGAFPMLYVREDAEEKRHLGELFFRLSGKGFSELELKLERDYGVAKRLPTIVHYRDLWDIDEREFGVFLKKLKGECKKSFVVVYFNDIREAMPMVSVCDSFYLVEGKAYEAVGERWKRYAGHEFDKNAGEIRVITMPAGYEGWGSDLDRQEPEMWLGDPAKKTFIQGLWKEL
ncbi:MAG: hypothetical protein IJM01_03700 [Eubacterium sp.]|nr:hypothetical protein [Eubacterium sp.]